MWEVARTEGKQWSSFAQLSNSTKLRILTAPVTTLVSPSTTLDGTLTPHHIPGLFQSRLTLVTTSEVPLSITNSCHHRKHTALHP